MARHPLLEMITLSARVPRGHDGFWRIIRELDKAGPWTIGDVAGETNVDISTVSDFVRRLVKGGYARTVPPKKHFRLLKHPSATPRLRRDGSEAPVPAQERMWAAMRALKTFTNKDIAFAATLPEAPVRLNTAIRYLTHLEAAGYLAVVTPGGPARPAALRLKPGANTGPLAPKILSTKVVFDMNCRKVMSGPVTAEECSP
jgi:hypothetical protein